MVELDPSGTWRLVAGHGAEGEIPLVDDHPITLLIEGSEIGGTAACNEYGGRFELAGGTLSIGEMGMTAMGCDAPVAASEAAYVAALAEVSALRMDGAELVLTGDGVELRFTPPRAAAHGRAGRHELGPRNALRRGRCIGADGRPGHA